MTHVRWPDIVNFHTLRRTFVQVPELLGDDPKVFYKGKLKLHGTCAALRLMPDGQVLKFSRETVLTAGKGDNAGFAAWVDSGPWASLCHWDRDLVVFGEWCGPGIQKGVAINKVPERIFAVFAIQNMAEGCEDDLIVSPEAIRALLTQGSGLLPHRTYVLPWDQDGRIFEVDWSKSAEELASVIQQINARVFEIEACDPWVKELFGIEGIGEGLVLYPVSRPGVAAHTRFCFKAKGEKHATVAHTKPVQAAPASAESAKAFATLVCTPARLEQGARAVAGGELSFDITRLGDFLKWISADVVKETRAEMEASGQTEKQASPACVELAKAWYKEQVEKT